MLRRRGVLDVADGGRRFGRRCCWLSFSDVMMDVPRPLLWSTTSCSSAFFMVKDGTYCWADVQRCKPTYAYASNLVASRGLLSDMEWATATEELILTFPQAHHIIYHEPLKNERSHEHEGGGGGQGDVIMCLLWHRRK